MKKDLKKIVRAAEDQGWKVEYTRNNHMRWTSPSGQVIHTSSTPSDGRALKNHLSLMKRAGYKDTK